MTAKPRARKIAVLSVADPVELAEQLADVLHGRAAALDFLDRALRYLRGQGD